MKLNLKPETEVADLVAWISSITCKQFVLPDVPASHAKVTIVAPSLITSGEAYRLFLDALDSVGLTVYPSGPFFRIVESGQGQDLSDPGHRLRRLSRSRRRRPAGQRQRVRIV